jgi:hypothetical protein
MKHKISTLGKVLDRAEQKEVNGGLDPRPIGIKKIRCYLGGQCIRYGNICMETICWYNPA